MQLISTFLFKKWGQLVLIIQSAFKKDLAKCASVYKPMYTWIACHVCNRMRFMDGTLNMNIREYLSANTVRVPKSNSIS